MEQRSVGVNRFIVPPSHTPEARRGAVLPPGPVATTLPFEVFAYIGYQINPLLGAVLIRFIAVTIGVIVLVDRLVGVATIVGLEEGRGTSPKVRGTGFKWQLIHRGGRAAISQSHPLPVVAIAP